MINKDKAFEKIPNNFFYDNPIREKVGWRDAVLLYFLFTSRKNLNNEVYISNKNINDVLGFNKNLSRAANIISNSLDILKEYKLIDYDTNLLDTNNNVMNEYLWIDIFPKYGGEGWIKFYCDDFVIHRKIGNIPYLVMWILRMYKNYKTETSYISITDIAGILECDRNKVQNSISLFEKAGLFTVKKGEYYFSDYYNKYIKPNNEYNYTENTEGIMNMDDREIRTILFPERNTK